MRYHRRVARFGRHRDRIERFRQRTDLIRLDENAVRDALIDSSLENPGIRNNIIKRLFLGLNNRIQINKKI